MSHLPSLPPETTLLDVFRAHPGPVGPLLELHERVMRAESPLTPGQRELIAAYVSGLNGCGYCHGVHTATAEAFGVPAELLPAALADLDSAPVEGRMRPLLHYVRVLTLTPSRVAEDDAEAVYAAGWDERALHDAIAVCALFNYMNRVVEGAGIRADDAYAQLSGRRLRDIGYAGLAALL
ncbi:carboxymuconolactone decarboxylase family protein [Actinomycetospora atypica]|uniref:Carboxymuconolactone decarboxylase family protein n=1 Tax=Actinomycetospora atypica TaxID=1290095 RepID=A0ABV9YNT8_9PSEU